MLYLLVGALVVVVIGFAIYAYQEESQPDHHHNEGADQEIQHVSAHERTPKFL